MTRTMMICLLGLLIGAVGCRRPGGGSGPPPEKDGSEHFRFRPEGGSTTVLGKARDRALDMEMTHYMKQVMVGLEADYPDGSTPKDKAAWLTFLRDYKSLYKAVNDGDVIAYGGINLRRQADPANTVLMYETRIARDPDAIVLTCDGATQRMTKAKFDTLKKPK